MLHLISKITVDDCILERIGCADVVVLLDGAALRTLRGCNRGCAITKLLIRARCCVLNEHISLYGITEQELLSGIEVIDYIALVDLTVAHPLIQTWN